MAVRAALASLEDSERETLELTYYAGSTAPEVAQLMGVPVGTVRSRLARGLRRLFEALRDGEGNRDER